MELVTEGTQIWSQRQASSSHCAGLQRRRLRHTVNRQQ